MLSQVGVVDIAPNHLQPRRKKDVGGQDQFPAAISRQEKSGIHCTGLCMDLGSDLDGPENLAPKGFDLRTSHLVATRYTCRMTSGITLKNPVLTFKRRVKYHLPSAGIIRSSPYSPR